MAEDYKVAFGGVAVGDQVGSIGVRMDRSVGSVADITKKLVGRRLSVTLIGLQNGESEDQGMVGDVDRLTLSGSFDVKRVGVSSKNYGFRLTTALESIDLPIICRMAKRSGTMAVTDSKAID